MGNSETFRKYLEIYTETMCFLLLLVFLLETVQFIAVVNGDLSVCEFLCAALDAQRRLCRIAVRSYVTSNPFEL